MKIKFVFTLCFIMFSGCFKDPVEQSLSQLEDLKQIVNNTQGNLGVELEKWRTDLPTKVKNLINDDVQKLSQDIIGSVGKETKCTVDFLRVRFSQSIENIRRKLLGQKPIYHKPCFCSVDIPLINPNKDPISETLNFYGYDFDNPDSSGKLMKVILVGDNSSMEINSDFIGRSSNYQLTVNLLNILPELASNKYKKIKIFWNGDSTKLSEALIASWQPEINFDPFQPGSFSWASPHSGPGDNDFNTKGSDPAIGQIQAEIRIMGNEIQARAFYDVMELYGDNTRVGISVDPKDPTKLTEEPAWGPWHTIYTNIDPKYDLIDYSPAAPARFPFSVIDHSTPSFHQGSSAISEFTAFVDQNGDDIGYTHVDVLFNKMYAVRRKKQPGRQ